MHVFAEVELLTVEELGFDTWDQLVLVVQLLQLTLVSNQFGVSHVSSLRLGENEEDEGNAPDNSEAVLNTSCPFLQLVQVAISDCKGDAVVEVKQTQK